MKDNIFVTAFFDIGRDNSKIYSIPRSTELYFQQFEHWSNIKNHLVCFCDPGESAKRIQNIRHSKGLEHLTEIVEIDIQELALLCSDNKKSIYSIMSEIEKNENTKNMHLVNNAMSCNAKYSYVMYIKYYCICESVRRYGTEHFYTWIDFGFDKNGMRFGSDDFDRIWMPSVSKDKITFFALHDPSTISLLEMLILQTDCMIGDMFIVPGKMAHNLLTWALEAIYALLTLEVYDDDQMIMLIIYKKHKEFIECYHSTWVAHYSMVSSEKISVIPHYQPSFYTQIFDKLRMIKHHQPSDQMRIQKMSKRIKKRMKELRYLEKSFEVENYGKSILPKRVFK